jgi:hypothetical protein
MELINPKRLRARRLLQKGNYLLDQGQEDEALAVFLKSIALNPQRAAAYYNIGLIYKYRNQWPAALEYNQKAHLLDPADDAACWNTAIAATALRQWDVARACWQQQGMRLTGETGPIEMDFGPTPVRLNPEGNGEVVWTRRLCPVRARIENIPFAESGFRFGDIVLHDGAAVGYRESDGREYPVFNVLELFEASQHETWIATVEPGQDQDLSQLSALFEATEHEFEDWSRNTRTVCRQCSEGRPHERHDHDLPPALSNERRLGVAIYAQQDILPLFQTWQQQGGGRLLSLVNGEQSINISH